MPYSDDAPHFKTIYHADPSNTLPSNEAEASSYDEEDAEELFPTEIVLEQL